MLVGWARMKGKGIDEASAEAGGSGSGKDGVVWLGYI